jgi:polyisoprenoid-binding protein YceI
LPDQIKQTEKYTIMTKTKWLVDLTHSELCFKIRHLMISNVSGTFKNFAAEVDTEDEDFSTARINLSIEMASITTNNDQRDALLLNSDFFEVEKFPEIKFKSIKVEKIDSNNFALYGELTLKGVTHPVKLDVEFNGLTKDPWGGKRAGFLVTGKINRTKWGLDFNALLETGGVMLSEEVKISAEIQLVKQAVDVAV